MSIRKVQIITNRLNEDEKPKKGIIKNSTEDMFPYIESAIDILDSNLKWWKNHYSEIESFFGKELGTEM